MMLVAAQGTCQMTERRIIEVDLRHARKVTKKLDQSRGGRPIILISPLPIDGLLLAILPDGPYVYFESFLV